MFSFDDSTKLKILASIFQWPFYILGLFLKFFVYKTPNEWDTIRAPQNPRTIVITGASQGSSVSSSSLVQRLN